MPEKLQVIDARESCYYQTARSFSPILLEILNCVQRELALRGNLKLQSIDYKSIIKEAANESGVSLNSFEVDQLIAYLEESAQKFGIIESLIQDEDVNDVIVSAFDRIEVQKGRKNFKTHYRFSSPESYEAFVEQLLSKCGVSYSHKHPIVDAMFSENIRIHAVHRSLCAEGPYLTVRINRYAQITTESLLSFGIAPLDIIQYLQTLIACGQTILIAGEVGSGKTTLARALAATIPQTDSILVIEDTPEIQLLHPHVRYIRTRAVNIEDAGRISPSECIRAGMRMAMNRIIFGEIRDAESAEAFIDVCASGHSGLSTIHAKSASDTISRLELFLGRVQKGAGKEIIGKQIANSVQCVVHLSICKKTGLRRVMEVREVCGYADQSIRQSTIFSYRLDDHRPGWDLVAPLSRFQEVFKDYNASFELSKISSRVIL